MNTVIITDSGCDLPRTYLEENNIELLGMNVIFQGKEFLDDLGKTIKTEDFYAAVRKGEMPSTSQINVQAYSDSFKKYVSQNYSIIYLCFSSGLSGSINSAELAKNMLLEEYPTADINIIDTKSASMGQGLIVYYANEMLKIGKTKDEIICWVETNKMKVNHWFTVDDLNHLKRGGRVSPTAAAIGTLLSIKPVLIVDREGHLIPLIKSKGRKKSLKALVDKFNELAIEPKDQTIFISHGDCLEDALLVKEMIEKESKVKDFVINPVGPVIGSHTGPGMVALFFIGKER